MLNPLRQFTPDDSHEVSRRASCSALLLFVATCALVGVLFGWGSGALREMRMRHPAVEGDMPSMRNSAAEDYSYNDRTGNPCPR